MLNQCQRNLAILSFVCQAMAPALLGRAKTVFPRVATMSCRPWGPPVQRGTAE